MVYDLTTLSTKKEATIVGFNCDEKLKKSFLEDGFLPGTQVCIDCISPFGGPIMCTLRNCKIALRRHDAAAITVQVTD
jgi:Fe2+ transport system protein FeoA